MPTDEQRMREQFDAFVYERTVNRNMSGPWPTPTELAWLAWQARDAEVQALREALRDMLSGWHYIRANHGDLYGVGWERAQTKAETALAGGEAGETE